jgi:hypothetical protein
MEKEQEKETRYPWKYAPLWARYAGTNFDGTRWWFEQKPYHASGRWHVKTGKFALIVEPCMKSYETLEYRHT